MIETLGIGIVIAITVFLTMMNISVMTKTRQKSRAFNKR